MFEKIAMFFFMFFIIVKIFSYLYWFEESKVILIYCLLDYISLSKAKGNINGQQGNISGQQGNISGRQGNISGQQGNYIQ